MACRGGLGLEGVGYLAAALTLLAGQLGLDGAEGLLVLLNVVAQGEEEVFGVLGRHDDAALHACLGHVGAAVDEVDEEFRPRMCDHCEVAILAGRHLGRQLDFEFLLLWFLFHSGAKIAIIFHTAGRCVFLRP